MHDDQLDAQIGIGSIVQSYAEHCASMWIVPSAISIASFISVAFNLGGVAWVYWLLPSTLAILAGVALLFGYSWYFKGSSAFAQRTAEWVLAPSVVGTGGSRIALTSSEEIRVHLQEYLERPARLAVALASGLLSLNLLSTWSLHPLSLPGWVTTLCWASAGASAVGIWLARGLRRESAACLATGVVSRIEGRSHPSEKL